MSGAQTVDQPGGASPAADDPEVVASAIRAGWKPREQYTGDPEKWKPAAEFIAVQFERPAVLAENYRRLDSRFDKTQRELEGVRGQLGEALSTVSTLTSMVRNSEQRAYDRARRELLAERDKAVETGDKDAFKRADAELETLKPPPAAAAEGDGKKVDKGADATAPNGSGGTPQIDPEIRDFWNRNAWYGFAGNTSAEVDVNLTREADGIFFGLQATRPDLSQGARLVETERRVRQLFPDKFAAPRRQDTSDNGGGAGGVREEPSMVTAGGENGGVPRRSANKWTFDTVPKASRDVYEKYKRQLDGKGPPLTKEEWAHEYHLQDQGYVDWLESQGKL